MQNTLKQYNRVLESCRTIFTKKLKDYDVAWRVLRPSSVTDQIYIKACRIRNIEQKGFSKIEEGIIPEFIGIINYAIIGLIQLELGNTEKIDMNQTQAIQLYNKYYKTAKDLMEKKNHDYAEAWRNMRVSSLTDLILVKINRVKQIENNEGKTNVSEGIDANYLDIINYSTFALIKIDRVC